MVKNSKAKVRRTKKNYGIDLSDKVELPSIEDFQTRQEFNEWKQKQSSFLNRANTHYQFKKNDYGVVASVKEINTATKLVKEAQRQAIKERERIENIPVIRNGKVETTRGQILQMMKRPDYGVNEIPDFDFNKIRSRSDFNRKVDKAEKRADPEHYNRRMERMKENFIRELREGFNSEADEIADKLEDIPTRHFYEMYLMFEADGFTFDLFYEGGSFHKLEKYVDDYFQGKIDFDLIDF